MTLWTRHLLALLLGFTLTLAIFSTLAILAGCQSNPPSSSYPGRISPDTEWVAYGTGTGITARLGNPFAIPTQSSGKTVNYVYTAPMGLAQGKTLTLNYTVIGPATFAPLPESNCGVQGCGPALLRLFIWGNASDTSSDRWWCSAPAPLVVGDNQTLSCIIDGSGWTGVNGQSNAQQFNASVGNPFAVGFTFGGMFAGHGVWSTSGSATFKINGFTVQ